MASVAIQTREESGRVPTPVITWPITEESFKELAQRWRGVHVWLSLWNPEVSAVAVDGDGPGFWTTLWKGQGAFSQGLADIVRGVLHPDEKSGTASSGEHQPVGPWLPDIGVMVIPLKQRTRLVGAVLGCVLMTDKPGEAFTRLCDQSQLDREAMLSQIRRGEVVAVSPEQVAPLAGVLELGVRQSHQTSVKQDEIVVLTGNLENTYEELHLIYEISAQMALPQKPVEMLERVGMDLLDVSRAKGIAFALCDRDATRGMPGEGQGPAISPVEDRVVQVGSGAPKLSDIEYLLESLDIYEQPGLPYVLMNSANKRNEYHWTRGWLEHLVALPLWHGQRLLGALLAINCSDSGDFTSVDVQLLRAVADRVEAAIKNQYLYDDLAALLMGLLHSLVSSIDAKDPYTCGHSQRVAHISRALAQRAGLSAVECERVYLSGLLHDIGKLGVAEAILCKPGKLTTEEFDSLKKHPEVGMRILSQIRQVRDLVPGVLSHHERVDGRGYPHGLSGMDIPLLGRIVCLADCFDAMTTNRTYRAALPVEVAVTEIRRCSGTQFDPRLAELFVEMDLRAVMKEARASLNTDPAISHTGALNAVLEVHRSVPRALPPRRRQSPHQADPA